MVLCFSAKASYIYMHISCFQWCFAFQQNILAHAFSGFTLGRVKTFLLVRLVVSRFTSLLVCCLYVVFCFSAKYPFFKWCFALQPNIIRIFLASNGVLLFSKASLYIFTLSGVLFSAFTLSACYSLLVFTLINHSPGGS